MSSTSRLPAYLFSITSLIAALVAMLLVFHHFAAETGRGIVQSVCGTDGNSGCNAVNRSPASEFLGLPVALWGFWFYGIASVVSLVSVLRNDGIPWATLLRPLVFTALAADLFLALYSGIRLGTICTLCAVTWVASIIMAVLVHKIARGENTGTGGALARVMKLPITDKIIYGIAKSAVLLAGVLLLSWSPSAEPSDDMARVLDSKMDALFAQYMQEKQYDIPVRGAVKGAPDSRVTIIEFADPLCPYCREVGLILSKFSKDHPEVKLNYRHYPLDMTCNPRMKRQLHEGACVLSEANECAAEQGKFWEFNEAMFGKQELFLAKKSASKNDAGSLARETGLDQANFRQCLESGRTRKFLQEDMKHAEAIGLTGTPTLLVNGRKLPSVPLPFYPLFLDRVVKRLSQ